MYYSLVNKTFQHIFYIFFHSSFWRCKKLATFRFSIEGGKSLIICLL